PHNAAPLSRMAASFNVSCCFLIFVVALGELDVDPGWIRDVRGVEANLGNLPVWLIELDAFGLELLAERFQVLDLESDVIDRASSRAGGWSRGRRLELESHAGGLGGVERAGLSGCQRERLDVPIPERDE